ncbi:MAG: hypothetical protein ACTTJS_00370 [Wolinella sp.]
MNLHLNNSDIIEQLVRHGYSDGELASMSEESLKELFLSETRDMMRSFASYLDGEEEEESSSYSIFSHSDITPLREFWHKIKACNNDNIALYSVIDEMIHMHEYSDILELLSDHTTDAIYKKIELMVRIKYREFQEWLLDEIARYYCDLPIEEFVVQMSEYVRQRDDIDRLKKTLEALRNPQRRDQILALACAKNELLKLYRRNEIESFYSEYYENTDEKKALVDKILKLTNAYTVEKLKKMKNETLEEIHALILESMAKEQHEKEKLKIFMHRFEESIYQNTEEEYDDLCREAISELSGEQMEKVVEMMETANALFAQRLKNILKDSSKY